MGPLPTLRDIMSSSLFVCQILRKLLKMPSQVEATLIHILVHRPSREGNILGLLAGLVGSSW
jgi:hypothetical protein